MFRRRTQLSKLMFLLLEQPFPPFGTWKTNYLFSFFLPNSRCSCLRFFVLASRSEPAWISNLANLRKWAETRRAGGRGRHKMHKNFSSVASRATRVCCHFWFVSDLIKFAWFVYLSLSFWIKRHHLIESCLLSVMGQTWNVFRLLGLLSKLMFLVKWFNLKFARPNRRRLFSNFLFCLFWLTRSGRPTAAPNCTF